jgi:hypothetical protein
MKHKGKTVPILASLALAAAPLAFGTAMSVLPSSPAGATNNCPSGWTCFWTLQDAGGAEGNIQSSNHYWGTLPYYGGCTSGSWNDCAESIWNREGSVNYFWENAGCTGWSFPENPGFFSETLTAQHSNSISANKYDNSSGGC